MLSYVYMYILLLLNIYIYIYIYIYIKRPSAASGGRHCSGGGSRRPRPAATPRPAGARPATDNGVCERKNPFTQALVMRNPAVETAFQPLIWCFFN